LLCRARHAPGYELRPFTCAAYDESMAQFARPGLTRPVRWSLWLGAGVLCGLILGFAMGLAKPRFRK
jgi:hypothetical protein